MGMTDLQFKDFLRGLINDLERIKKAEQDEDSEKAVNEVDKLLERYKAAIED